MFEGTYTALVTPFRDGQVDYDAFQALIDRQAEAGIDGIVPVGTTGESPTITPDEHIEIIKRAWGGTGDPQRVTFTDKVPYNTRGIIDACRSYEHRDVFPPVAEASPEFRQQIQEKWKDLLV